MKIRVKSLANATHTLEVDEQLTISALKERLENEFGLGAADKQKLIHLGKILQDDATVSSSKMTEDCLVVVMVSKKQSKSSSGSSEEAKVSSQSLQSGALPPHSALQSAPEQSSQPPQPSASPQSSPAVQSPPLQPHDSSTVENLMALGFARAQVELALRAAFGHPDRAAEYLFTGIPDNVQTMMGPPPSQSPSAFQAGNAAPQAQSQQQSTPPPAQQQQDIPLSPQQQMQRLQIQNRLDATMKRAFFDMLETKLSQPDPPYDWVVKLYEEIRDRLISFTPRRQDLVEQIKEAMDVELFDQMLRNNAYDGQQIYNLVQFVFDKIKSLEAPARNNSTNALLAELEAKMADSSTTFSSFVPMFLRHAHTKLDEIRSDIQNYRIAQAIVRSRSPSPAPSGGGSS